MGLINIDNLEPGMKLGADLHTPEGRFLLPAGADLTADHIKICKTWGVDQADIEGYDQAKADQDRLSRIDPELLNKSKAYLRPYLKGWNVRHPAMNEIIRIAIEKTAHRMESGDTLARDFTDAGHYNDTDNDLHSRDWSDISALSLVKKQSELISLPDIFYKILEVLESPFSSASHIADVVSKDMSLSAKLLKLVNSAFYGFPSQIASISRAVAILGTKELTSLAMGISLMKSFEGVSLQIISMEDFWKHSIACGIFAGLIASRQPGLSQERFFVAGLLHDIGRLIMIKIIPDAFSAAALLSIKKRIPAFQAEKEVLGFDHARVGGLLCREWKLPVGLEQMIHFHHEPSKCNNVIEPSIIHLANILAISSRPEFTGQGIFPVLSEKAWQHVGLKRSDIFPVVQQADRRINEIVHIFLSP